MKMMGVNFVQLIVAAVVKGGMHLFSALRYSIQGIGACLKDEVAFRQECLLAVPHFIAVLCLPIELWIRFYLGALWFIMIAVELLNTSIEAVSNLASPEWSALAKKAKDCGSAAVFCVATLFAISWIVVLIRIFSK